MVRQEYRVEGNDDRFGIIVWSPYGKREPCPVIVVHLPDRDLDNTHFSSPQTMRELGGVEQNQTRGGHQRQTRLKSGGIVLVIDYKGDSLESLKVAATWGKVRVMVDGKDITLPATKQELLQAFGPPEKAKTSYSDVLAIDDPPKRSEPHL